MKFSSHTVPSPAGKILIVHIENNSGAWVELSSLGAGILGVGVPDREGNIANVALSYADPADYCGDGPCLGKCPGRYANRIAGGYLKVGDRTYQLAINCGPHHLHGGPGGFHNRNWAARLIEDGVEFTYHSPDGEENYPGNLAVTVTYRWSEDNVLTLEFHAVTDADTVINMTNHAYWNLRGADSGTALDHEMRMKCSRWLPTDDTLVPVGLLEPVRDTPMDFTEFKKVGRDIRADFDALRFGNGYDHCWAIDDWRRGRMSEDAVVVREHTTGRVLTVDSDQPGVQVYTANWMADTPRNRSGRVYADNDGLAIEMQGFPDAPNEPRFPSQLLKSDEAYRRIIRYKFSIFQ